MPVISSSRRDQDIHRSTTCFEIGVIDHHWNQIRRSLRQLKLVESGSVRAELPLDQSAGKTHKLHLLLCPRMRYGVIFQAG